MRRWAGFKHGKFWGVWQSLVLAILIKAII